MGIAGQKPLSAEARAAHQAAAALLATIPPDPLAAQHRAELGAPPKPAGRSRAEYLATVTDVPPVIVPVLKKRRTTWAC
jgi:hypothetical protein